MLHASLFLTPVLVLSLGFCPTPPKVVTGFDGSADADGHKGCDTDGHRMDLTDQLTQMDTGCKYGSKKTREGGRQFPLSFNGY